MLLQPNKDQRNSMKLKAEAFYLRMQAGVPLCFSQTTANQRKQEIKHLKGFFQACIHALIFFRY